jgi:hypothetical protein
MSAARVDRTAAISAAASPRLHNSAIPPAEDGLQRNHRSTWRSPQMNGRTIAGILLAVVLIGVGITVGVTAYNAGVSAGLAQTGQVVVTTGGEPVGTVAPYVGWGWGWGHGFGFFGFLGFFLFLILLFALFRAAFGFRRGWGGPWGGSWGQRGPNGDWRMNAWEDRMREAHDALHREQGSRASGSDQDRPANG